MERTITRIKNLKARRKLSLPASPNPTRLIPNSANVAPSPAANSQGNGGGGGGGSNQDSNTLTLPYSRIRSRSPEEFERQQSGGGGILQSGMGSSRGGVGNSGPNTNKGGGAQAQRTVSERYRKVQWSPDVRGRLGELEAIRQSLRNGEVSGRAETIPVGGSNTPGSGGSSGRRASLSVRHTAAVTQPQQLANSSSANNSVSGSGRYRRSDSVSTVEEESLRRGGRNHTRHGSLPHVFRNLYLHPGTYVLIYILR